MLDSTVFHSFENSLTSLEMSQADFESVPAAVCRLKFLKSFTSNFSPNLGRHSSLIFDKCNHTITSISSLSLQFDHLTTIPKLAHIFPSLQSLNLYGNYLYFSDNSSLAGLTSLTHIYLGYNHLTRIPFAINKAFNLRELWIEHNEIDTIETLDLSNLHNLTTLNVRGNPIVHLSPLAFAHNPLLNHINLRFTNLKHVPRALIGLNNLRTVYLNGISIECSCHAMDYLKSWNVTSVNIDAYCSSGGSLKTYLTADLPKCP